MATAKNNIMGRAGTFQLNHDEAIHSWYSYVEGYSSCFVEGILDELDGENIKNVYDPFCGTGTTPLVASQRGLQTYYSETNPFMCSVIEAKINCVRRLTTSGIGTIELRRFLSGLDRLPYQTTFIPVEWGGFEKYFDDDVLAQVLQLKGLINKIEDEDSKKLLMLALSSIIVPCSKMIRRGDLRFAKPAEKKPEDHDVLDQFRNKVGQMIHDIETDGLSLKTETRKLCDDARDLNLEDQIDCVITSPPYLNGTNYIRNTKLELKLNDFVMTEADLPKYHSKGIIAGINNISKRNAPIDTLPIVKPYIDELKPVAYDRRIVEMVTGYFFDIDKVVECLSHAVKDKGLLIMDIGDSQFAGVHIPTYDILSSICEGHGFEKYDEVVLRERRSKNGMTLSQRLLKFRLRKPDNDRGRFEKQAINFITTLPYKQEPYSGRNWGHPWHSLCSYYGKLKPAIAHFLIEHFTEKGDVVLDPLCGVGTIPFEACLQGRVGIGNDLSEMAYIVTKAKVGRPALEDVSNALRSLEEYIKENSDSERISKAKKQYSDFGYNGKLPEYFHPDTFSEVLCAREYYKDKLTTLDDADAMVYAALLHVLHGNRPYALSRNSHPLTPYAPTGEFVYKNVVKHIRDKIEATYKKGDFSDYIEGKAIYGDFSNISGLNESVDVVITSPPFADSVRFYMMNWMRLWLCGWEANDFKTADDKFLDVKQKKDFTIYKPFFEMCSKVLKKNGRVVLHLGKTKNVDMADELSKCAAPLFTEVYRGSENVGNIEKHGIKDKGATTEHEFLFLIKK